LLPRTSQKVTIPPITTSSILDSTLLLSYFPAMTPSAPALPRAGALLALFNLLACFAILPLVYLAPAFTRWPCTLDGLIGAFLAEFVRYQNEGRKLRAEAVRERRDMEKGGAESCPATMAQVVGWKEEPELFSRALESYQEAEGLRFLLLGVDGDSAEDMEMVDVFQKVCHPEM
jgi:hyaluronan synthase